MALPPQVNLTFQQIDGTAGLFAMRAEDHSRKGVDGDTFLLIGKKGIRKTVTAHRFFQNLQQLNGWLAGAKGLIGRTVLIRDINNAVQYPVFLFGIDIDVPKRVVLSGTVAGNWRLTMRLEIKRVQ
tara:strand:- start:10286 stop:10663 length:378 start_codon:yes stop_codon:yes gene_type:complete